MSDTPNTDVGIVTFRAAEEALLEVASDAELLADYRNHQDKHADAIVLMHYQVPEGCWYLAFDESAETVEMMGQPVGFMAAAKNTATLPGSLGQLVDALAAYGYEIVITPAPYRFKNSLPIALRR